MTKPSSRAMRLNRFLASCGLGSRRSVERLIVDGKVEVNGKVVRELATRVDPDVDQIRVGGELLNLPNAVRVYRYYKPRGVIASLDDEKGRRDLAAVANKLPAGCRPAGRLDRSSEGLILWSNDGRLIEALTSPASGCEKVYRVTVDGHPGASVLEALQVMTALPDGTKLRHPVAVRVAARRGQRTVLEFELREGKNRQIRQMCEAVGLDVRRLVRIRHAGIDVHGLPPGTVRPLPVNMVNALLQRVGLAADGPG